MRAGGLDRRVTIQQRTLGQSASGAATETWADFATVWAGKRDLKGREFFDAQKENAEISTEFRLRWRSDVTAEMRLQLDGLTYDIVSIAELARREGLLILATAPRT